MLLFIDLLNCVCGTGYCAGFCRSFCVFWFFRLGFILFVLCL